MSKASLCVLAIVCRLLSNAGQSVAGLPFDYPENGCVVFHGYGNGNGNGNGGSPTPYQAPTLIQAVACMDSFTRFQGYDNSTTAYDMNILTDRRFSDPGNLATPYMQTSDLNALLHGLDVDFENQWGMNWTDLELNYNYFYAADPTVRYGSFGVPQNMYFPFTSYNGYPVTVPSSEFRHIDMYLTHPWRPGPDTYPAFDGSPDPEEDGNPDTCDELILGTNGVQYTAGSLNAIRASAGFKGYRSPSSMAGTVLEPDVAWSAPGGTTNERLCHEMQHLLSKSRTNGAGGARDEMRSMGSEYLMKPAAEFTLPVYNTTIDVPFYTTTQPNLGYIHWYLWSVYILQKFAADTTQIEDDLYYKWVRKTLNPNMRDLALVLGGSEFASYGLGSTGAERLSSLFHRFSIAKWLNNPSPTFYGGWYGFGRGFIPSMNREGPFFRNWNNYCYRNSATELPRRYKVGPSRLNSDSLLVNYTWCVVDSFTAFNCNGRPPVQNCDPTSIGVYSADYMQFDSDSSLVGSQPYTLRFKFWWDPSVSSLTSGFKDFYPRVAAITYPVTSDSLYLLGTAAGSVIEGSTDTNRGIGEIAIPGFGSSARSVVIVIDLGERTPATFSYQDQVPYSYSFGVDHGAAQPPPGPSIALEAYRTGGNDLLNWSDPGSCGASGYYVQRSIGVQGNMITIDSTAAGVYERSYSNAFPPELAKFYKVVAKGTACVSNRASCGGDFSRRFRKRSCRVSVV